MDPSKNDTRSLVVTACVVLASTAMILGIMWADSVGHVDDTGGRSVAEQQSRQ